MRTLSMLLVFLLVSESNAQAPKWLLGHAYKVPSEYSNQESGYFSIIEGKNGRIYVGTAKYGVNGYLLEFDPKSEQFKMVMDVQKTIGSDAKGFAAQAKLHSRNNVGASGKIYVGSKQGYPEKDKGEKREDYKGGYVLTYDPATGQCEHFGIAKPGHGIISVMPDEERGVVYVSTCSDDRPIDHTHFMVLDLKQKTYRDLGDHEHAYAFIVLDHLGRAYHPKRGGKVSRYDPRTKNVELLDVTIDGQPAPPSITKDDAILNWDASPERRTLWAVEMTTNQVFSFDLTADGPKLSGRSHGELIPGAKQTDCRAMCVGPDGNLYAAVTLHGVPDGPMLHLATCKKDGKPRDHGPVGVANPGFTELVDKEGKPKPYHHTMRKVKDGTLAPWQPMGICKAQDGHVYVTTIAPFALLRFKAEQMP